MLKETYFGALKATREKNPRAIFIIVSRSRPTYSNSLYDKWFRALAPSQELLSDYKKGLLNWEEYTTRFHEEINKWDHAEKDMCKIREMLEEGKDVFLVCWEKSGENCHRYLLIDMILEKKKIKQETLF